MPQQGSIPNELWVWAKKHCGKYGFRYPSQLLQQMINEARKLPKYANLPQEELSILDETNRIGDRAKVMAGRAFSIARATSFKKKQLEGYKEALKDGTLNQEQYDKLANELNVMVQANVNDEMAKMNKQELLPTYSDNNKPKLGRLPKSQFPDDTIPHCVHCRSKNVVKDHRFGANLYCYDCHKNSKDKWDSA